METTKGSVAVIGAGIVGICTALELQREGYQVTLIDKGEPVGETSKGNASFIAVEALDIQASPKLILSSIKHAFHANGAVKVTLDNLFGFIPWGLKFLREATSARREASRNATLRLHQYTVDAWKDLLARSGNSDMIYNCGYLKVWEDESALDEVIQQQIEMQDYGYECQALSGADVFEKEPALSDKIKHALFFPNTLQLLEPHQTGLKLFDYFIQQGGEFRKEQLAKITTPENRVNLITDKGEYTFDKTVVCAGVWSRKLCEDIGLNIPLVPERGYHLTYLNSPVTFKHLIKSEDRHVVLTPLSTGMRITGFGEFSKIDSKPVEKRYQQLGNHMKALIGDMKTEEDQINKWMGRRPSTPDSLPVIDLHPDHPQIGMVFGHQHLGVTQSPMSAKLITAMIEGDKSNQTLKDFEGVIESFAVTRFT